MSNQHFVISGNQIVSNHATPADATSAAVLQAKQGKTVFTVSLVASFSPNTGVVVTNADGSTETVQ